MNNYKMNLSNICTIAQLKVECKMTGSHFFDADTMRFFRSRIAPRITHTEQGIVFITSEQFDSNSPRLYTVRIMQENGQVKDFGGFQGYKTLQAARKAAKEVK